MAEIPFSKLERLGDGSFDVYRSDTELYVSAMEESKKLLTRQADQAAEETEAIKRETADLRELEAQAEAMRLEMAETLRQMQATFQRGEASLKKRKAAAAKAKAQAVAAKKMAAAAAAGAAGGAAAVGKSSAADTTPRRKGPDGGHKRGESIEIPSADFHTPQVEHAWKSGGALTATEVADWE